ncbi:MAG: polysaccharide deacetylase family protein [Candidatus Marinimicrobia bacterium]|nr:polysaccharide deacetylase family protein [Candidatus Neomarinimicrobiota bacterium]
MLKLIIPDKYTILSSKWHYVIDHFNSVYKLTSDISIAYGEASDGAYLSVKPGEEVLDFFRAAQPVLKNYTMHNWKGQKLPLLFNSGNGPEIVTESHKGITINYDIVASAFYFLSSWQEWHSQDKDKYGRFPAESHLLYKLDCLKIPVVNYYFDILAEAIIKTGITGISLRNEKMQTLVTHDIDECMTGWGYNAFWYLKNFQVLKSLEMVLRKVFHKDIWFNFDKIMEIEEKMGISATYFFLPSNKKTGNIKNADYNIKSKKIEMTINDLIRKGHEIGIHGSFGTGLNNQRFETEILEFDHEINGGRFHYLAINLPKTFEILEQSGLKYDSSMGFARFIGFRNGYCYPYYPYNITLDIPFKFLEFPLMIMDITLENEQYMNCAVDTALDAVIPLIEEVGKFNGTLNLLWHNKFFSGYKSGWGKVFVDLIRRLKENDIKFIQFKDCIKP